MLNRRSFLQCSISAGAAMAATQSYSSRHNKPPNVLLLVADDMNDYGINHRYAGIKMPYLSRLRESSIYFDHAYCPSPVCTPSRAATFSGLYPHTTGAYHNGSDPWKKTPLNATESLPECFKRNGYQTFGRGKLFHAKVEPQRDEEMWDNDVFRGGFKPFPPDDELRFPQKRFFNFKAWEGPDIDFPDVVNSNAAIDYLQQDHSQPFFMTFGIWRPHTPYTAPKRFFDQYNPNDFNLPAGYKPDDLNDVTKMGVEFSKIYGNFELAGAHNPDVWQQYLHAYAACSTFADWTLGRVVDALDKSPYADNTIVIFWSDNGYHCGEKNHWQKATLWELSALTPMMIRMPGSDFPGKTCSRPVNLTDLYPTLTEVCTLSKPEHSLEGRSLIPLINNPSAEWRYPSLTTFGENCSSVRDERYRYLRYPDGTEELYDHSVDPHEFKNIASDDQFNAVKENLSEFIPKQWAKSLGGRFG